MPEAGSRQRGAAPSRRSPADAGPAGARGRAPDGAGCASAATVKRASGVASHVAPSRGRSRTLDRGSWRAAGLNGREAGGCEARGRLSRAGRRTETVPRPAADATPICRIDYPRGVPVPRACPPTDSPRDPTSLCLLRRSPGPTRRAPPRSSRWLARVGAAARPFVAASLRPASSDASFRRYFRADREARRQRHRHGRAAAAGRRAAVRPRRRPDRGGRPARARASSRPTRTHGFLLLDDLGSELYLAGAAGGAGERRPASRRPPDARRDRRPRHLAAQGAGDGAAAVRRRAAAPRARALSRLVRDARVRRHLERGETGDLGRGLRPARRRRAGAAGRRRAPRLDAEEPDGRRSEPGHPRLPGRGRRADRLRRRLAAARRLHLVGRGAGARLGDPLLGSGAQGEPAGAEPTSASSGAASNGSACSAT